MMGGAETESQVGGGPSSELPVTWSRRPLGVTIRSPAQVLWRQEQD